VRGDLTLDWSSTASVSGTLGATSGATTTAIAKKLAGEGASVVVNDLDAEPAEAAVAAIRAAGGTAEACVGSVTADGFAERFVGTALDRFGGLDIIVNNAGYTWDNVIQKMEDVQWDAILDVHLKAPFRILRRPASKPSVARNASARW
jgi:3-oxoacyl-[acyl-carrier protein] reductase